MSKVIYLVSQPIDEWNFERFGIQSWIDRGWNVEIWDFTPRLHPRAWTYFFETGHKLKEFEGYFPITSIRQLNARYVALGKIECYIDFAGYYSFTTWVKMRLSRMGAMRVTDITNSLPIVKSADKCNLACKVRKLLARHPVAIFEFLVNAFMDRWSATLIRPGLVVVTGEKSFNSAINAGYSQEILKAHNFGYDFYLKMLSSQESTVGDYAVFLDQDLCFNSSYMYSGLEHIPRVATPEKYFPTICNGLRMISDVFGVNLSIAAGPRSSYQQNTQDYFQGIPVEYRTADLVKNSRCVVCHCSTSIELAVLFGKPAIFVTTDELEAYAPIKTGIALFASELGKSVINLDRDLNGFNWKNELHIDTQKYAEYKNKYVKTKGSPEIPHWTIIIDHIERIRTTKFLTAKDSVKYPD